MYAHQAIKKGQTHLSLTDHGRLGGVLDHIDACRHPEKYDNPDDPSKKRSADDRLIPLVGMEAYYRPNRFMELTDKEKYGGSPHMWANHLTLTANSLEGWRSLMRLSSQSWVRRENGGGYFGRATIDPELLERNIDGLIISTACVASPLSQFILKGDEIGARRWLKKMIKLAKGRVWGEIMPHDFDDQRTINIEVVNLCNSLGIPFVATGDVHIPYKEWHDTHLIVMMSSTRQTFKNREKKVEKGEDVYGFEADTLYLSSGKEMRKMFQKYHPDLPLSIVDEALANTQEFIKQVKPFVIGKTPKLPKTEHSDKWTEKTIRNWCKEGLKRIGREGDVEYVERYEYEFSVLKEKGVLPYFYLVGDGVRWAKSTRPLPGDWRKRRKIRCGLGRGSAAGCLVSYLIGITAIDPIAWGLLFERFLNPDRIGLPDIDLDFETGLIIQDGMDGRDMVKEYYRRKYGRDHVADIIAYQTFAPRAVIKAISDVFDIPHISTKRVTDSIGETERDLVKIANHNEVLAEFSEKHPEVWKHCLRLESQIMRDSKHAAGVLITPQPVNDLMPTQLGVDEVSTVTAFADRIENPVVSDYGFVKLDVLGVNSLGKQELCCQLIKKHYGEDVEPNDLEVLRNPYAAEQAVLDVFVNGLTIGIFQFEGSGITKLLRHIKPTAATDLCIANALYRPGPIKIAFEYGDRKNGSKEVEYWHPSVEPVLKETLGLVAYQEQIMEVCKLLGNFTGGQADAMRKAMSKLYRLPGDQAQQFMQGFKDIWDAGCKANGIPDTVRDEIWQERMLPAGDYLFNKSHAGSYSLQAYQDGWLKEHYPLAFYASLFTTTKKKNANEQSGFLRAAFREARIFEVEVLPPDVNRSDRDWIIDDGRIRFGLVAIRDMGANAADLVKAERTKKAFRNFNDFIKRMPSNFNSAMIEALAMAGAFDTIDEREKLLARARNYPPTVAKVKVEMTCGCKRSFTAKVAEEEEMPSEIARKLEKLECKKHEGSEANRWEEVSPYTTFARYAKEHSKDPEEMQMPSQNEVIEMEVKSLNIPVSVGNLVAKYEEFIEDRIFTSREVEEMPSKPQRSKGRHGFNCVCEDCEAAHVVIGGEVVAIKEIKTKKGDKMAFVDIAFGINHWNCTFFPFAWTKYSELMREPRVLLLAGYKDQRGSLLIYQVSDVTEVAAAEEAKAVAA
jgi:DNA polymerase-3 subunit alpha